MLSVVATAVLLLAPDGANAPGADPLPLYRVIVPANRIAKELERVRRGVLIQQPRAEFEALVRRAAGALERGKNPPRLTEARYRARLDGASLVGSGDWTLVNPTGSPGIWSISGLNLALRQVKVGARDAVIGDLDGKNLGLFLDPEKGSDASKQAVSFDWSLRGGQEAGGLHFELQIAPCPIASLELTLPADATVTVSRAVAVLSGPHDAGDPGQRLWRLRFTDRSAVDLVIRHSDELHRSAALTVANLTTMQRLTPARLRADFDIQVEILHRPITRLVLDMDPLLEPFEVSLRNIDLKEWQIVDSTDPGRHPQKRRSLIVELREAFLGTLPSLRVRCLARLPGNQPWSSPWMHLRDAAVQGETLRLEVHPDVRLENWQAGSFRLVGTATAVDGTQTLTLVGTEIPQALPPRRPSAQVRTQGVDFLARQRTWWLVGAQSSSLTAEITYEVSRGTLIELPVVLPVGWQVNDVALEPNELLRNWVPVSKGDRSTVVVDLQRGLTPRQQARLTIRLHSTPGRPLTAAGTTFDFPDLAPQDPCVREATLGITVDPLLEPTLLRSSLAASAADEPGPWGSTPPMFYFNSRNQPVTGALRVTRRPPKIQASCGSQFVIAPRSTGMSLRLGLEAISGTARTADVLLSAPLPEGATWKCVSKPEFLRSARRVPALDMAQVLLALGQRQGLATASALALSSAGERWRLSFNSTLKSRETFLIEGTRVPPGGELPLLTVPGAAKFDGEVSLFLAGTEATDVRAVNLTDSTAGTKMQGPITSPTKTPPGEYGSSPGAVSAATVWRTYHYDNTRPFARNVSLAVRSKGLPPDRAAQEFCDHARLITELRPGGGLVHSFTFDLWNWRRRVVPVRLPADASLLAARIDGRWIDRLIPVKLGDVVEVGLPVTAGDGPHRLEIIYTTPHEWPVWAIGTLLACPRPQLPVGPVSFRQTWRLPPGIVPLSTGNLRKVPSLRNVSQGISSWDTPVAVWGVGSPFLAKLAGLPAEADWLARQRQGLEAAETALRQGARAGAPLSLSSAFQRLAQSLCKDGTVLALDAPALQAARLRPRTRFIMPAPAAGGEAWHPFWESLGLVYISCPGGVLLTTRAQMGGPQVAGAGTEVLSVPLEAAIHDAGADGHDTSGRFQSAWDWAAYEEPGTSVEGRGMRDEGRAVYSSSLVPRPSSVDVEGTEWEVLDGALTAWHVTVVREQAVSALGVILTSVLVVLAWTVRHLLSARWRFLLLIGWLATAVLAVLWLPPSIRTAAWGPALAGLVVALCWYGHFVWRQQAAQHPPPSESSSVRRLLAGTTTTALGVCVLSAVTDGLPWARSQQPEAFPVLLVPLAESNQEMALVSPELLDRLRTISQRAAADARDVVPVRARYEGKVNLGRAEFKAEFQLYNFAQQATLNLPLSGIELKEGVLLDGVDVNPALLPGAQGGYAMAVVGRGPHTLNLAFTCRLAEAGAQADLTFGVPRLPQSHVVVTLPAGSAAPSFPTALGLQKATAAENGQVRIEAELGREDNIHLRWRVPSSSSRSTAVQVREAYLWDLRQPVPGLTAVLTYTPVGGAVGQFAIELPDNVVVRSVEARQAGAAPESVSPPRLKSWRVVGQATSVPSPRQTGGRPHEAGRFLHVDLQTPFASPVQLTLGLVPQLSTGSSPLVLALPAPKGVLPTEGFIAYRVNDLEGLDKADHIGVTNLPIQAFGQVWTAAGMPDPGLPMRAYTFRRTPGGMPALVISLEKPHPRATQEVSWHIQQGYADVHAQADINSTHEDVMLVEWTVPADLTVAEVRGPDVDHWARSGDRVQTWLRTARQTTHLDLSGWVPWTSGNSHAQVTLPAVHLASGIINKTLVRIASAPALAMEPAQLQNLIPVTTQDPRQLCYLAKPPAFRAVLNVRPAPGAKGEGPGTQSEKRSSSPSPLAPHPSSIIPPAVQILSCEQQATLGEGRHWVHQAAYLMFGGSSDIRLELPAGARLLGFILDGKPLSPRQPNPESLLIRLGENAEPHRLAVRWSFGDDMESIDKPNLASPHFEGLNAPAGIWILDVPTNYEVKGNGGTGFDPTSRGELELLRAGATVKSSALLAQLKDRGTAVNQARIRRAQQEFFDHLKCADYQLALMPSSSPQMARRARLLTRIKELTDENARLARQQNFDQIRLAAEKQPVDDVVHAGDAFFALRSHGTPTYWLADAEGKAPRLHVTVVPDEDVRRTAMVSILAVLFLAGIVLVWHLPRVGYWICRLWPEQLMLIALLGCQIFGLSPLGVVLFLSGAFFRLVWLVSAVQRRFSAEPRLSG